jgi:vacuolar-type H+-ATPase subunit D/Vma8
LVRSPATFLTITKKRVSGVYIDSINIEVLPPTRDMLKRQVQGVLEDFADMFPVFIELIQLKLNCSHIAQEILKTNRQIANLEKTIETINGNIKYIRSVLSDKENLEKGILMKIFL